MRRLLLIGCAVLAGCGSTEREASDAATAPANQAVAEVDALPPSETQLTNAAGEPVATAPAAAAIPAAFRGRWGMVPADCTSTRGDAKGLMTIEAERIRFYESRAVPTDLKVESPERWTAVLAFEGEGQNWTERTAMTLGDGGQSLTRTAEQSFTYRRCPA